MLDEGRWSQAQCTMTQQRLHGSALWLAADALDASLDGTCELTVIELCKGKCALFDVTVTSLIAPAKSSCLDYAIGFD